MDESTVTHSLAISLRNKLQRMMPGIDPDAVYYALQEGLLDNWDQFIEAASLAFVQREIYEQLKLRFEQKNAMPSNA